VIITEKRTPVQSTITGESAEFRIATNAKAFRVLVDGIYSDKVGSIVRELLSNAYDSHVRAGAVSMPFEVRLPTALNPTFSVRDFGVSMTHEFVMSTYSTLFASDKSTSNTEVGAFGLGAKSFLAYTDACTLTCWRDGEMRSYAIALNDGGVPEVLLVHRGPSHAATGVEVTFAVAQGDFTKFHEAANTCAVGFDVHPTFFGGSVKVPAPSFIGDGWRIFTEDLNIGSTVVVRQGCAVYRTNDWRFRSGLPNGWRLMIDVPIGEANVTASRESLALTADQEDGLRVRIAAAVEALAEQVRAEYHALPTPLERAFFADRNLSLLGSGDWPVWVDLPTPLMQWDAGALVPRSRFAVRTIRNMTLLYDDGTPMLRRKVRLRALAKSGRYVYVSSSKGEIEQVRRLLDLRPEQVRPMSSIPDVAIQRTAGRSGGAGRQKKQVDTGTVWAIAMRNDAQAGPFFWNRTRTLIGVHSSNVQWVESAIRTASGGKDLVFLTKAEAERALSRGTVQAENRVDEVLRRAVRARLADFRLHTIRQNLTHALHARASIALSLMESLGIEWTVSNESLPPVHLFDVLLPEETAKIKGEATIHIRTLADRYPLLFGTDLDACTNYIALCDRSRLDTPTERV